MISTVETSPQNTEEKAKFLLRSTFGRATKGRGLRPNPKSVLATFGNPFLSLRRENYVGRKGEVVACLET